MRKPVEILARTRTCARTPVEIRMVNRKDFPWCAHTRTRVLLIQACGAHCTHADERIELHMSKDTLGMLPIASEHQAALVWSSMSQHCKRVQHATLGP